MAYLYRHIRLDKNEVFYVGVGNDDEGEYKRAYSGEVFRRNSKIWQRIVAKTGYNVEIVLYDISWQNALEKEKEFIALYGRIDKKTGTLSNQTDGGQGVLGLIQSQESIKRSADAKRGKKQSEESNRKRSESLKKAGRKMTDEHKRKLSMINKGRPISTEMRIRISNTLKGRKIPLEVIEKIKKTRSERVYVYVGRKVSEETKIKIGNSHRGKPKPYLKGKKYSIERKEHLSSLCKHKKSVVQYSVNGELIAEYDSQKEAAFATGLAKEAIGRACRGLRGYKNNYHKGFVWKHKTNIK